MAVLYIDPINGNDTNPAQVVGVTATNVGGLANINKTAHGLVTGDYIITSAFTSWLNKQWQITKVDNDNFTLNGSVWQTTADPLGNYYHQKATSWATAWKTPNACTTNYIVLGDEVRFAKSPDPVSIGNATWTRSSSTVTLATAQTEVIDNCETVWTAANGSTVTLVSTSPVKQGNNKLQISSPLTTATATKYAYRTLPATLNLSAYQEISFWLHPNGPTNIDADTEYEIKLCSDTLGDTVVDTFKIKSFPTSRTGPMTLKKDGGGNLGSSIKSIAIYSGTTTPAGNLSFMIDHIIATKTNGLNLNSVISKSSSATYNHTQEPWHSIMSIVGTTVTLDVQYQDGSSTASSQGKFYYWTTGTTPQTVTTYARDSYIITPTNTNGDAIFTTWATQSNESYGLYHTFSGGWDTTTNTQNGMTFYDLATDYNSLFSSQNNATRVKFIFKDFGVVRGRSMLGSNGTTMNASNCKFENLHLVRNNSGFNFSPSYFTSIQGSYVYNNITMYGGGFTVSHNTSFFNNIRMFCTNQTPSNSLDIRNSYVQNLEMYIVYNRTGMMNVSSSAANSYFENITLINDNYSTSSNAQANLAISGNNCYFYNLVSRKGAVGISFYETACNNIVYGLTTSDNYRVVVNAGGSIERLKNAVVWTTHTESLFYGNYAPSTNGIAILGADSVNGNVQDNRYYISNGYAEIGLGYAFTQTTTRHTASDVAWQINILDNSERINEQTPITIPIGKFAVNSSGTVTFKAWVKLSDNTKVAAKILIPGYQVSGFTSDVTATKANDNNWEELSVSFTPNKIGVVEAFIQCWNKTSTSVDSVYVDDISISQ